MKNQKKYNYTWGLILFLVLFSCSQSPDKTSKKNKKFISNRLAIELILKEEVFSDSFLLDLKGIALDAYRWKNHIVLFGSAEDTCGIIDVISNSGINVETKYYCKPMYIFNRSIHCNDTVVHSPRKDYLLTANLVKDTVLQEEYIRYHNNQFEEWSEVAQGFCNADFQELLVYKNERQLLLVISIPADKTLDELNPKTTENNPRMKEWNRIMGKYQEGIEGTNPGETWVFLNKIN